MGIRASKARSGERRTFTVEWEGEEAKVTYDPAAYTPLVEEGLSAYEGRSFQSGAIVDFLGAVLVEWEVMDEEDRPLPCSREVLASLPVAFLMVVLTALQRDLQPPGEASGSSLAG